MPNAWMNTGSDSADTINIYKERGAYPQESKVLGLKENPWRVEKEEASQNGLRVFIVDLGKLSSGPAIFLLDLIDVLVTEVSDSTKVNR